MGIKIIAEAGVNHNGDVQIAKDLVAMAAGCGADYIKFQTFSADSLASDEAGLAKYQSQNLGKIVSQKEMLKSLELNFDQHYELIEECNKFQIGFLSSPFDNASLKFLTSLGLDYIKVPSGELVNRPFLKLLANFNQKVLLSTGMCNLSEVRAAIDYLECNGQELKNITLMQCTSQYPAPFGDLNLRVISEFKRVFNCEVGFSDHSLGVEAAIGAVTLGADIVEKHVTLDRAMEGPDHVASLDPNEFKKFVESLRNISVALGDGIKRLMESEVDTAKIVRKSIFAKKSIKVGEIFSEVNLTAKRPGSGISSIYWDDIIGRASKKDYQKDDLIDALEVAGND